VTTRLADVELRLGDAVWGRELQDLFDVAWPDGTRAPSGRVLDASLCWVTARVRGALVGFVNVATDGGAHAFVLDTTVHPDHRRAGLGVRLVEAGVAEARRRGVEWVHVDFEPHLEAFYAACGFGPSSAGLLHLPPA